MSKKYAFLLMGKDFNPQRDHACFSAGGVDSYIITVRSPEEAVKKPESWRMRALARWRSAALLEKICPGNVPGRRQAADSKLCGMP